MYSGWDIGKLSKGRLVPVVALLFLFHTGVDLLFPQLCSEEPVSIAVNQSLPVSKNAINGETSAQFAKSLPNDSGEDRRSDPPRDEDCFCCCTHVMPSPGFVNPESAELKLPNNSTKNALIPSAPLNTPYHPPRFV